MVQVITFAMPGIEEKLDRFFDSLAKVNAPEGGWALVITDHPSPHGSLHEYYETKVKPRIGKDLPETIINESDANRGYSGGHQYAYDQYSKSFNPTYIYPINEDTYLDPNIFVEVVKYADAHPNMAIIQSRLMLAQHPTQFNSCGNALQFLGFGFSMGSKEEFIPGSSRQQQCHNMPMFYTTGAGVLIRTSVIDKIGGIFEPSYFMYHEDVDICWRAQLAGFDIGYAEDSVLYHHYEFSKSMKKFYWMERNRHLTNLVNYKIPTLLLILPATLVMECGTFIFALKSGWWKEKIRSWTHFAKPSTWKWITARRKMIRGLRVRTDRELLEHMTGIITAQEIENPLVTYCVNPVMNAYFMVLKLVVRW